MNIYERTHHLLGTPASEGAQQIRSYAYKQAAKLIEEPSTDLARATAKHIAANWSRSDILEASDRINLEIGERHQRDTLLADQLIQAGRGEALCYSDVNAWIITDEFLEQGPPPEDSDEDTVLLLVRHGIIEYDLDERVVVDFLDSPAAEELTPDERHRIAHSSEVDRRDAAYVLSIIPAADLRPMTAIGTQYRVRFRRQGWKGNTSDKAEQYETLPAALRQVAKLRSTDREDLSPVSVLHLEVRDVTRWRDVTHLIDAAN